jgi:hypothetical protein
MTANKWPGAHHSDRAGNTVLRGTLPHTIEPHELQLRADTPCRLVGWRVSRWLAVEMVEVANGR